MNYIIYPILTICFSTFIRSMEVEYKLAQPGHTEAIVKLINEEAVHESDKIVVLPEKFRRVSVESAIDKKRLYIAMVANKIIAYKKLFLMSDDEESASIFKDELRLGTNPATSVKLHFAFDIEPRDISHRDPKSNEPYAGLVHPQDYEISFEFDPKEYVAIYDGSDFTAQSYRRKDINFNLTRFALEHVMRDVDQAIKDKNPRYLALVYGLTHDNAHYGYFVRSKGALSDDPRTRIQSLFSYNPLIGRTSQICRPFAFFIKQLLGMQEDYLELNYAAYPAFKPSFDPNSDVCQPLSDDQSVPGYGCLLAYDFVRAAQDKKYRESFAPMHKMKHVKDEGELADKQACELKKVLANDEKADKEVADTNTQYVESKKSFYKKVLNKLKGKQ